MEVKCQMRSGWWEVPAAGPCMVSRRLIDRHNQRSFDPFSWLAVCYCSPEFDRGDIIPPPEQENRETLNYLVTGLVDPPDLEDERGQKGRWVGMVGGLVQSVPSQSVYVLNMELWMATLPGAEGGGKRWEFESEQVPLVRTSGAQVRVLCGKYGTREGAISSHPLDTTILDVTLCPGGSFDYLISEENTCLLYVFGGKVFFGKDAKECYGKDSFLRVCGGKLLTASFEAGGRFLLFSARPVAHVKPIVCPANDSVCRIKK